MPVEPPTSSWVFPPPGDADEEIVGVGADLEPGTLLAAYRSGIFPMPLDGAPGRLLGWWSPDPRGVLPLDGLRVSRSLRKASPRFEIRVDTAFAEVVEACADPRRPSGWISPAIARAYVRLHRMGWAHSVEAWSLADRTLAGGLYGVAIGGLFAGESMFHLAPEASKVALVGLVDVLTADGDGANRVLDVQWRTDHLASLGAVEIPRDEYLYRLATALDLPAPRALAR